MYKIDENCDLQLRLSSFLSERVSKQEIRDKPSKVSSKVLEGDPYCERVQVVRSAFP